MQAQRDHLNRNAGDVEIGVADILRSEQAGAAGHQAAHLPSPPRWLTTWERRRPPLLVECFAEFLGVGMYVFCGVGASATLLITTAAKETGFGSLLTIGFAYALGIAFAIVCCAGTSGGHLSPSFTIAFCLFKGFPVRKVPFYIGAQLCGGFCGALVVAGIFHQQLAQVTDGMRALGLEDAIFSAQGPAGLFGLMPGTGQELRWAFFNEFIGNTFLAILVFSVLDACNFFVSLSTAPFVIGMGYAVIIWAFSINSVALNASRDIGGRMACAVVYGSKCFTAYPGYTAIAALTTFPATLFGVAIQTLLLSDSARMIVNAPPSHAAEVDAINESRGFQVPSRAVTRESVFNNPHAEKGSL
ncbi:uncharacterized protein JCM6883_002979 [Sporobolomyces salmoneus]|uniref:uncharacterized protein n=1 Tax=Sporobolomyces salmoneus TaxID=183962 RepID=UPI00317ADEC8